MNGTCEQRRSSIEKGGKRGLMHNIRKRQFGKFVTHGAYENGGKKIEFHVRKIVIALKISIQCPGFCLGSN